MTANAKLTRRDAAIGIGAIALSPLLPSPGRSEPGKFASAPNWMTLLGTSEQGGRDYAPRIEGEIPQALKGSLYRNGPGLFERGGYKIKHLLDGDGLIQRLSFTDAGVRYQNAFVQTEKFITEQAAEKRLYATWTTRKSDNVLANIGGNVTASQAGVTVYPVHGKILARDELGPTYEIDPLSLKTGDQIPVGSGLENVGFKAHSKLDPENGEWILAGNKYGRRMSVHVAIYEPTLRHKRQFSFVSPRQVYVHDFFASKNHLIFVLHPCNFSPLPFLSGFKSFTDSFDWQGDQGNLIAVLPRTGGTPTFFEAPGSFMWHALNAYEENDEIIADFVGYDDPDHFIGDNALFTNLMAGKMGRAKVPGTVRRYRITLADKRLNEEILDTDNHEFPMIDNRATMTRHTNGYFAYGGLGGFNTGVKSFNYNTGVSNTFNFGSDTHVGEPVFVPAPGDHLDRGYLLAQCLDGKSGKTFFALFDAQNIDLGPISKIWLKHHVPISFHGAWQSA